MIDPDLVTAAATAGVGYLMVVAGLGKRQLVRRPPRPKRRRRSWLTPRPRP